jgi:ribonuclease VapC
LIVDTSALLAILYAEEDAEQYAEALATSELRLMSAANYLEAGIVVDSQIGAAAGRQFDALMTRANVEVEAVTRSQADVARQAYLEFGKGNHPAGLNFGDCFAYALAKTSGLPLLYKGNDFAKTDIISVLG